MMGDKVFDEGRVYAKYWQDSGDYEIGDYFKFDWLFEEGDGQRETHNFGIAPNPEIVARYVAARKALSDACEELAASLVPIEVAPQLPPVPEGHFPTREAYFEENIRREINTDDTCIDACVDIGHHHWHANLCNCKGACHCHWLDGKDRP